MRQDRQWWHPENFGAKLSLLTTHEKQWPFSGQLLRSRFKQLLAALGLQATTTKSLELSSLRPGAATWLLTVAENAELTRRRGGWISPKVMEIYVQETSAARFMVDFTPKQRDCIFSLANFFLEILDKCQQFQRAAIPATVWFRLLTNLPWCSKDEGVGKVWVVLSDGNDSSAVSTQTQVVENREVWVLLYTQYIEIYSQIYNKYLYIHIYLHTNT